MSKKNLSATFKAFYESERSGGVLLVICTALSLLIANSASGSWYAELWHFDVGPFSVEHWINDGLMAIFFLLIGLELERELYVGELSDFRNAILPIAAAAGGVAVPALIHFSINAGTPSQAGAGIPMATDIAFALAALALLGSRVPSSLKVFLVALAVMDDLAAIIVIAIFYTEEFSVLHLAGAMLVFGALVGLNRLRVMTLAPYLAGGVLMWILLMMSGVHPTISGVLLAFAIPFGKREDEVASPSHRLEHFLHRPVAFCILPLFALANTAIILSGGFSSLTTANSAGIMTGLILGKPLGITLASFLGVTLGICRLPDDLSWRHIFGAGLLGGIGFTMSIFITNLAFPGNAEIINASKVSILLASVVAGIAGFMWLRLMGKPTAGATEPSVAEATPSAAH